MTQEIISRAEILIQQKKFAEAERLLKELRRTNPNDVHILTLLSEVALQQDKADEATVLNDTAIGISPDDSYLFYIRARISLQKEKYDEAEENLRQALELEPSHAEYFALWASVKLMRKQYEKALELANKALELDAENLQALNTRSTALLKLNQKEESFRTIEGALREDPNNAYTHTNYGWNLLEKGDHKKALEHFREALKKDPNFQYAQAGMVEALKAHNLFYKMFLKYSFWISNLTAKYQWAVIIGFYVGFRVLRGIANSNETLQPYLNPLIVLLAILAFSTWIITPVSNLFLRLNTYGRHLLNRNEKKSSDFVGLSFLIFLLGVIGYLIDRDDRFLMIAVYGFAMMLPLGVMFTPTKSKYILVIYAAAMALTGILAITIAFSTGEIFNLFTPVFIVGFIAFQWVANYMIIKQSNV